MNNSTKAHLGLLGANLFYGAGFTVAKYIMPALIKPNAFIFLRVSITCLLFWMTYLFMKKYIKENNKLPKKQYHLIIIGGIFGVALNQLLFFQGLSLTTPIHASLIMLTTPILVTLLSTIILKQKLKPLKILGLALGVTGAALLFLTKQKTSTAASNIILGDIFVILNAISYAIYLVIIKPVMTTQSSMKIITYAFTVGLMIVFPFGISQLNEINWAQFEIMHWEALIFIIIAVTYCTYLWNAYAIKILNPVIAGAYIYTQPVFAAIISILYFNESTSIHIFAAALCIFVGVFLVNKKNEKN